MSELKARCEFHGVGQGLCYSGRLFQNNSPACSFVYDCGTLFKMDEPALRSAIDKTFPRNDRIDILFLSHLDKDHISGVPYLLERCEVENVFLPYLSPEESLLLAMQNEISPDTDLYDIYRDPVGYFRERHIRIFVVYPQDQMPDYFPDQLNDNNDRFRLDGNYRFNRETQLYECYGSVTVTFNGLWRFRIYQDQTTKVQNEIAGRIVSELHLSRTRWADDLKAVLKNKDKLRILQKFYHSVKDGINQSSLVLLHAPIGKCYRYIKCWSEYPWCGFHCGSHLNTATLLNGDINLNKLKNNGKDYIEFVAEMGEKIGIFLLPHHGSGKNASINTIKAVADNKIVMACSYGRGNKYHHPDAYMLDQVSVQMETYVNHVVAGHGLTYFIAD